jgi:hypothetical protein
MLFLSHKLRIQVLVLGQVTFKAAYFNMPIIQDFLLVVQLCVEIRILFLAIDEEALLIVDFLSELRDEIDVCLNSAFEIVLHPSFLICDSVEVLFKT